MRKFTAIGSHRPGDGPFMVHLIGKSADHAKVVVRAIFPNSVYVILGGYLQSEDGTKADNAMSLIAQRHRSDEALDVAYAELSEYADWLAGEFAAQMRGLAA